MIAIDFSRLKVEEVEVIKNELILEEVKPSIKLTDAGIEVFKKLCNNGFNFNSEVGRLYLDNKQFLKWVNLHNNLNVLENLLVKYSYQDIRELVFKTYETREED